MGVAERLARPVAGGRENGAGNQCGREGGEKKKEEKWLSGLPAGNNWVAKFSEIGLAPTHWGQMESLVALFFSFFYEIFLV